MIKAVFLVIVIMVVTLSVTAQTYNYEQGAFYNQQNKTTTTPEVNVDIAPTTPIIPNTGQQNSQNIQDLYGNSDPAGPGSTGGGGTPDANVPIDGGLAFLIAVGAAAGIRKRIQSKNLNA